jgi:hypothetical protein
MPMRTFPNLCSERNLPGLWQRLNGWRLVCEAINKFEFDFDPRALPGSASMLLIRVESARSFKNFCNSFVHPAIIEPGDATSQESA